jgi:hypothetical protein
MRLSAFAGYALEDLAKHRDSPRRRDRVFSIFGDRSKQGAVVDGPAVSHQNVGQYAGDRRANLAGYVVGVDLDQWVRRD